MTVRKIDLMHRVFGPSPGNKCKDCDNLVRVEYRTRTLTKCGVYGLTHSEASDWSGRYDACGMFNKKYHGNAIIRMVNTRPDPAEPIEGQQSIF